jgi:internalin A
MRLLTVFALLLLAAPARADEAEDAAVKAVEKLGGKVRRGRDDVGAVTAVNLSNAKVTAADLKALVAFKSLNTLNLSRTDVGDSALKELAPLTGLTDLNLNFTRVTDAGM